MATPTVSSTEVPSAVEAKPDFLAPDFILATLTWVSFFALLFILQKFAWKPILAGLQSREDYIRQSLTDADKAKESLAQAETLKAQILNDAKSQAAQIIDESRKSARALATDIEQKAKLNAQDTITNAQAQIEGERIKLKETLTKESAEVAISLAGKILQDNTNTDHNRRLLEVALKQL